MMGQKFPTIRKVFIAVLTFLLLKANPGYGAAGDEYFQIGVRAAEQQQYHVALEAFLKARSEGLETPELRYNLAVVYYRLAQYEPAREHFQGLTAIEEYAALAFYNLGLIELKLGNVEGARDNFSQAYASTDDEKLKSLSQRALSRVAAQPAAEKSRWAGFVAVNAGYDDNVGLIDEDVSGIKGIEDQHLELFAFTNRRVWGGAENGIHVDANLDILKQQSESEYDFSQWHLAFAHHGILHRWQTRVRAGVDQTRFGNVDYQQLASLDLSGQRAAGAKDVLELRYKYVSIDDRSPGAIYDYLAGTRQQARVRFTDVRNNINYKYSYELQLNDRQDLQYPLNTTTTVFRSYSPVRHGAQVSVDVPWGNSMVLSLEGQFRYSYYPDADTVTVSQNGETVVTSVNRVDHRYDLGVAVSYDLSKQLELFGDYAYTKNDSNRSGSDYVRNLIRAGVTWFY